MKVAQKQADSGEIISWTLLRSVYPAGEEARADYLISEISEGNPRSSERRFTENMELAGVEISVGEFFGKLNETSTLVARELWRPRIYDGAAEKGNYLTINMMKVKDFEVLSKTTKTWSPLSQEWIKQGVMTGWVFATKRLPSWTETVYGAYSADIYPTLEAAFVSLNVEETFAKGYPGKTFSDFSPELGKARSTATREMWTVVERISKSK